MRRFLHILLPCIILGIGIISYKHMTDNVEGEKPQKRKVRESAAIQTAVKPLIPSDLTIAITSQGEVRPHHVTTLTSEINGKIIHLSENFQAGAFFKEGDILLELDTADLKTDIISNEAAVTRAESAYSQEQARARQALLNWKDAGFDEEPSDLVLRKPQLNEAEANVISAKAELQRAQRNLNKAKIKAPYDGRVRSRSVGLGQQVSGSTPLGEIFSTDYAEIRLPLTIRDLSYYTPPSSSDNGEVTTNAVTFTSIITNADLAPATTWQGEILRAEGELDPDSRQLFVIARIDDPFSLKSSELEPTQQKPPIFIGQTLKASIPAKVIKGAFSIPRRNLTDIDEIIVIREGLITHVNITTLWEGPDNIIIRDNIMEGDLLSITEMNYAPEGVAVEIIYPDEEPPSPAGQANTSPKDSAKPRAH